jgi:hypothetical protein
VLTDYSIGKEEALMRKSIIEYSLILVAMLFSLPALAQNLQEGLVAYWEFEGNAEDSSGNGYNGEENGDVEYVPGKFGQALGLENDFAYVVVENNVDIQLKSADTYTVAAYVRPSDTNHGDILYHGLGCSTWSSWFLGMQGGEPDAALVPDSFVFAVRTSNGSAYTGISTGASAGDWMHVAATYDGTALKLYVDGNEEESLETGSLPYDSTEKLYIGGDPGCGGRSWYTGLLDDVRIYNRALTEAEIDALVRGATAVSLSDKLAVTWGGIKQ